MKVFIRHIETKQSLEIDVKSDQSVGDLKRIVEEQFKLDTSSNGSEDCRIVLQYAGCDLADGWIINDLAMPVGTSIRCFVKNEKMPDYIVHVKFKKESFKIFDTGLDPYESKMFELRVFLSNHFGLPLTVFRLKTDSHSELFDQQKLRDYGLDFGSTITLETWQNWDNFLLYSTKGFTNLVLKSMSSDEFIKQYQMRVALYIACFHGNFELASTLMSMGARSDRPVGEFIVRFKHPCRQWCEINKEEFYKSIDPNDLRREYLKCPIHVAVKNGQVKILTLIAKLAVHVLEKKDGYGMSPWRLALHNTHKDPIKKLNQKDVARFLLAKQFGGKFELDKDCKISISLWAKIKAWVERAKEKILALYGIEKSSVKRRPFHKPGLLGNKVLVDGFNNNFKESVNAYERLRAKYKYYYFIDDEDRDKHGYPDLYFKTAGLIKDSKSKQVNQQPKKQLKSALHVDRPTPKTLPLWKKAVNKIIFCATIKKYADVLIELGVEIDLDELNIDGESEDEEAVEKFLELENTSSLNLRDNKMKQTSINGRKSGETNRFTKSRQSNRSVSKSKKKKRNNSNLQKLPNISNSKLQAKSENRTTNNSNRKKSSNTLPPLRSNQKQDIKTNAPSELYTMSVNYFEEQYEKIKKSRNQTIMASKEFIKNETLFVYRKFYCSDQKLEENAKRVFEDVKLFKGKSWLQQIDLGTKIVKGDALRRIKKQSQIKLDQVC